MSDRVANLPTVRVTAIDGPSVLSLIQETTAIYGPVFSGPPYRETPDNVRAFAARLRDHVGAAGFRMVVARADERPIGFAYGYASRPNHWWHQMVRGAIGDERAAFWLADAFEFVELALLPGFRGRGIGSRLYDELFRDLPHQTAVASTADAETDAMRLYRRRRWVVLRRGFVFPGSAYDSAIIGLDLKPGTSH